MLSLRNLPFSIQVGAQDGSYNRNSVGRELRSFFFFFVLLFDLLSSRYAHELDKLREKDGHNGYPHFCEFPDTGHWMNGLDQEAVKWMCNFKRVRRPDRVVWKQNSDVTHTFFYFLGVVRGVANSLVIVNHLKRNFFDVEHCDVQDLIIYVDDEMIDFDKPIVVHFKGREIFNAKVCRSRQVMEETLKIRGKHRKESKKKRTV